MITFKQLITEANSKSNIKKVPASKRDSMWSILRAHFSTPSDADERKIFDLVDDNKDIFQIESGKNGGIAFVTIGNKIGYAEYVGENTGISKTAMSVDQLKTLLGQI